MRRLVICRGDDEVYQSCCREAREACDACGAQTRCARHRSAVLLRSAPYEHSSRVQVNEIRTRRRPRSWGWQVCDGPQETCVNTTKPPSVRRPRRTVALRLHGYGVDPAICGALRSFCRFAAHTQLTPVSICSTRRKCTPSLSALRHRRDELRPWRYLIWNVESDHLNSGDRSESELTSLSSTRLSQGRSEEMLGRWVREAGVRDKVVIATKVAVSAANPRCDEAG